MKKYYERCGNFCCIRIKCMCVGRELHIIIAFRKTITANYKYSPTAIFSILFCYIRIVNEFYRKTIHFL